MDKCIKCGNEFPSDELYYDGVEPDIHSPTCWYCMVKELQELYGVDNVILPSSMLN